MRMPSAIRSIKIPKTFAPSALIYADQCLLRVVFTSTYPKLPRLNSHPAAELGKVFHRLLELAARGAIPAGADVSKDVRNQLDLLLSEAESRLSKDDGTRAFASLSATLPPMIWQRKMRMAIDSAVRMIELGAPKRTGNHAPRPHALTFDELPHSGRWVEIGIQSETLRLTGRMDAVEREDDRVAIYDIKTGRIEDEEGQLLPEIDLQLRLYGLMVQNKPAVKSVRLFVDHGDLIEIPFGQKESSEAKQWLNDILDKVPSEVEVDTDHLAKPGQVCRTCSFRASCHAYLSEMPRLWSAGSQEPLPTDTWGEVTELKVRGSRAIIAIRDAAGRRIKVFGLRKELLKDLNVGAQLWLFGLLGEAKRDSQGIWRHAVNFYEVPEDDSHRVAWQLQVFSS